MLKKTTRLRQLFNRGKIFVIAGGGCALHARIAEVAGYECAYMSGGITAAMIYGIPDSGLITMTEMVQNAERMANCIGIPLISDADQGFGNAINVRRTVEAFIRAGVAGIHLEDQPFPKTSGFSAGKEVVPLDEAVGKIRAAVDARNELDPDFMIISRCDARGAPGGSVQETITRLQAYRAAGADVIYAEGLKNRDEVRAVRAAVEGPMMGTLLYLTPPPDQDELQELGYAAAFYPGLMGIPSFEAAYEYAHDFLARGQAADAEWKARPRKYPVSTFAILDIVGSATITEWEEKYLPANRLKEKYAGSEALHDPRAKKNQ